MPPTLYFTPDHARFFLLPAEFHFPAGELGIVSLKDKTLRKCDEAALVVFEMPKVAAHERLQQEMQLALNTARQAWRETLNATLAPKAPVARDSEALLRLALGWPVGQPLSAATVLAAARQWLGHLRTLLTVAESDDPVAYAAAKQKLATLRATLEQHGVTVGQPIEALPDKLAAWRTSHPALANPLAETTPPADSDGLMTLIVRAIAAQIAEVFELPAPAPAPEPTRQDVRQLLAQLETQIGQLAALEKGVGK